MADPDFSALAASAAAAAAKAPGAAVFAGCDLVWVPGFADRIHERFLARVFGEGELAECRGRVDSASAFGARWAAKEAAYKAFSQLAAARGLDAEGLAVLRDYQVVLRGRMPVLELHGRPAALLDELRAAGKPAGVSLSLTHDGDYAAAFVVIGIGT